MPSLKKNALYNSSYQVIRLIVPLITYPYVSRLIGPGGIGTVTYAEAVVGYFTTFALLGMPVYGTRAISQSRVNSGDTDQIFSELFFIVTVTSWISLLAYISLPLLAPALVADSFLFWLFAIILFMNGGDLSWFFGGIENYRYIAFRNFIVRFFGLVLTFVLVRTSDHYLRYGLIWFLTSITMLLINISFAFKNVKLIWKGLNFRRHLIALVPTAALVFSNVFYKNIDVFMVGLLVPDERFSVGLYSTASRIIQIAMTLITAAAAVTMPRVAFHHASGDSQATERVIGRTLSMTLFLALPMTVGTLFVSSDMIHLFAGARFYPSIHTLQILAPELILITLSGVIGTHIFYARGMEKTVLSISLTGFVIAILLNLWLIPRYTFNGAAVATVISRLFVLIIGLYASRALVFRLLFTAEHVRMIVATMVLALFLWGGTYMLADFHVSVRFIIVILFSTALFSMTSLLLKIETAQRIWSLFQFHRSR